MGLAWKNGKSRSSNAARDEIGHKVITTLCAGDIETLTVTVSANPQIGFAV